jgi:hypothetical protein
MSTFALILDTPRPQLDGTLAAQYPGYKKLNDYAYFFKADSNAITLSSQLLTPNEITAGAVIIRVTADYYGYSRADFWDWIAKSFAEGGGA